MTARRAEEPRRDASAAPTVEVVAVAWRRIQLELRLRHRGGRPLDAGSLALRRAGLPGELMPATASEVRDGDVVLRFNVMQGPGARPLAVGRWTLVQVVPGRSRALGVRAAVPNPFDVERHQVAFEVPRGDATVRYGVAPRLDRGSVVVLDVSIDPVTLPAGSLRPRRSAVGRVRAHVRRAGFQVLFLLFRLIARRNGRRILFTSDSRAELGGNLRLVHDRMVERGVASNHEILTLFKPGIAARRSLRDRVRLPWVLARADVIVIDDYQPAIYSVDDPDVRIVQLWHAVGAFKTVGYSRIGKPGGPDPWGRVHKNYSAVAVSATSDIPVYAEAFGIPEARVLATGVPRTDRFFDPEYALLARAAAEAELPAIRGRRTILYAPTFRGHGARSATFDMGRLDVPALDALCEAQDAVCIIRMHPFVREPVRIPEECRDRVIDGAGLRLDVNDLLFSVDLLVTDYSSIVYEFATLGRPMLFYAWDLEEYVASRDFYEPYEEFVPGRIVRTFDELLEAIRTGDCRQDLVAPFAARHFDHTDGRSTDRVVDLVLAQ